MQSSPNPNPNHSPAFAAGPGFKAEDILFIIFRHKWMIVISSLIGLLAATALYLTRPHVYQSEAKLLLRYVLERKSIGPIGTDAQIQSPDSQGENIINSELEILNSYDLAIQVAEAVGSDKILGKTGGESNGIAAAVAIRKGLTIDVPKKTSVIRMVFQHQNPAVVQPVLEKLMEGYLKKHLEVHRALGLADNFLSQQTEQLRFKLSKIEDDLWNLKTNSGSVSVEDFKSFSQRRTKILEDLSTAQAQLEERKAMLQERAKFLPPKADAPALADDIPIVKVNEYKTVCSQLNAMQTNLAALLIRFTAETPFVQRTQAEASELEKRKAQLEKENPKLVGLGIATVAGGVPTPDMSSLISEVRVLETKIKTYNGQLEQIKSEELSFAKAQNGITQLQRQKEVDEANYKYYAASMEQARIDETLGPGKISNIKTVQEPTPPTGAPSKTLKVVGGTLAAGLMVGIGLAFLIELFLDKTLRRPGEIKSRLHVSVFSTIPYLNGEARGLLQDSFNGAQRFLPWRKQALRPPTSETPLQAAGDATSAFSLQPSAFPAVTPDIAPWDGQHRLQPFFEELREQLINYFEAKNISHKPKLIAITSCSNGAGVSTLATGLAASLSETVDSNVLLVDMNSNQGGAHPFYKGKPGCGLPDVFELEKREAALVQEKLYLVKASEAAGKISRMMPKQFSELMPKILASDYGYVIFDMPPVTPGSVTLRLSPYMDMVFMVLEAEKTKVQVAKNASALLAQSNATVAPILNKVKSYVPAWLPSDL
jgi:uncharacterized protein involved in exopolysaccharide biosynthesis/Mrp family chromosome partitioning ATPase